jgi:small subunit ribosomal protein S1
MSDTNAPDTTATDTQSTEAATAAAASEAEASSSPKSGAVDTGRRIDPALLQRGTVRRGGRQAPPEDAVEGAAPAGIRVVEPRREERRDDRRPRGPVVDAATIAARAAAGGGVEAAVEAAPAEGEVRAPRAERGDRGPRREGGDRGPRRDGPGGRGDRGPRRDRDGGRGGRDGERAPKEAREPRIDFSGMAPIVVSRDDDVGDFAAMLAESGGVERKHVKIGDKLRVKVVHIGSDSVFFEVSKTQQGHAARGDYVNDKTGELAVRIGDTVEAFVVGINDGVVLSPRLGKDMIDVGMLEEAKHSQIPVDGTITGVNKGGFEVSLGGSSRGFCPTGQIDVNFVEDPSTMIGKTLAFLVREVKEGGKNVVLTRRALLEKERAEKAKKLRETIGVGAIIDGVITRIQPFGAFVDLGGLDGLIPVSELSFNRVTSPEDVVKVGDAVRVEVIRIEQDPKRPGQERIGLSLKSQLEDPFTAHADELVPGSTLVGRVARLEAYGAFVELFPGLEGLVHVSEITDRRILQPEDVLKVDEHVQVLVKDIEADRRRVSLSMREADPNAAFAEPLAAEAVPATPKGPQKPKLGRGARCDGVVDRIERYGVFLNLFAEGAADSGEPIGSALMPASETGTPRGSDLGKAFPIGTKVPVLVIDVDDRGRLKASKIAREQAEERAVFDQFKSDKGAGGKAGLGTFGDLLKKKFGG